MEYFKLHLISDNFQEKVALYNPYTSDLIWENDNLPLFHKEIDKKSYSKSITISPENPGHKVKELRKIKIQLGFACNFTCNYCSQNNQRDFFKDTAKKTLEKVPSFLSKMDNWFDGGADKLGAGVHLEFWGGETLLYWESVKVMTEHLRKKYPNMFIGLFTNGSLVKKEMADFAKLYKLHFVVSHDGPTFTEDRGKDPFDHPVQAENLKYLFSTLSPLGLISFNATISIKNYSLMRVREYIAGKIGVNPKEVILSYDLATPYDSEGLKYITDEEKRPVLVGLLFDELKSMYPFNISVGMVNRFLSDFYESIQNERNAANVGQKCSMDQPTSIAIDIDGNVLTCQNVNANGGHKVGTVEDFENIKLNTSYHWSNRKECTSCPVVQICKGSCMFLKDQLWESSCDQHFTWSLAYLSFMIYAETGYKIKRIEGERIRREDIRQVNLING